jgi:hypothetical protein
LAQTAGNPSLSHSSSNRGQEYLGLYPDWKLIDVDIGPHLGRLTGKDEGETLRSQLGITPAGSLEEKSCSGPLTETPAQLKSGPEGFRNVLKGLDRC